MRRSGGALSSVKPLTNMYWFRYNIGNMRKDDEGNKTLLRVPQRAGGRCEPEEAEACIAHPGVACVKGLLQRRPGRPVTDRAFREEAE